jgi:hydroxymethylpyrimidine pyrophosphatase-like HAD family hydrolase
MPLANLRIRLIVCDVDGVLTDGEATPWDLDLMAQLAAMNRIARHDSSCPAVTLCTGRPAPFVDALMQAIDGHLPAVFEGGVGLYDPDGYRFFFHPAINDPASFRAARQRIEETLVRDGRAYFQPGKEISASLFATDPVDQWRLLDLAAAALGPLREGVELEYSASCLNIAPRGINKASGLAFLAERSGFAYGEMLGLGDSDVDLPFLALAGFTAAPANANRAVQQAVQYVSPHRTSTGVRDILRCFIGATV